MSWALQCNADLTISAWWAERTEIKQTSARRSNSSLDLILWWHGSDYWTDSSSEGGTNVSQCQSLSPLTFPLTRSVIHLVLLSIVKLTPDDGDYLKKVNPPKNDCNNRPKIWIFIASGNQAWGISQFTWVIWQIWHNVRYWKSLDLQLIQHLPPSDWERRWEMREMMDKQCW